MSSVGSRGDGHGGVAVHHAAEGGVRAASVACAHSASMRIHIYDVDRRGFFFIIFYPPSPCTADAHGLCPPNTHAAVKLYLAATRLMLTFGILALTLFCHRSTAAIFVFLFPSSDLFLSFARAIPGRAAHVSFVCTRTAPCPDQPNRETMLVLWIRIKSRRLIAGTTTKARVRGRKVWYVGMSCGMSRATCPVACPVACPVLHAACCMSSVCASLRCRSDHPFVCLDARLEGYR